jgi:hypothetical protein
VRAGAFAGGWIYAWMAGVALLIAAVSLAVPSTPSYDPWAWIVWGREILHLNLHTPGGPTWKPLPVIFTTLFAPFGSAAPDMWLVVARAGALLAVAMVFKVAARLVWWLRDASVDAETSWGRLASFAPSVLAGVIAAVGLGLSGGFLSSSALGYSEGLMVACVLIALERHLDGHRHQAFAFAFAAALTRPEVWPFWGIYGLWLMWRDPSSRRLVIGLFVLAGLLWFVPQYWGSGSFSSGFQRAQHPRANSPAFASCPFCTELSKHAWPLVLLRIKVAAVLAVLTAAWLLFRGWRTRPGWKLSGNRDRALVVLALIGVFGLGWWILVALETQSGFSGNDRYLVLGSALIEIAGGVGFGWAALGLARAARRWWPALRARAAAAATVGATALLTIVFFAVPNWVGGNLIDFQRTHASLVYQAHLRQDVASLVARAGGAKRLLACGPVMAEGFQVPMVAWYLGVHTIRVEAPPAGADGGSVWPAVIFQTRDTRHAALLPEWATIRGWEQGGAHYTVTPLRTIRFFEDCGKHA